MKKHNSYRDISDGLVIAVICLLNLSIMSACEPPDGVDINIAMVSIPAGTFEMGCSPERDTECNPYETPPHTVTISAFKMSAYEITQGQWADVMDSNPSYLSACGDDCPVEMVSWNDVQEFIEELNSQTSKNYRLPTEAEWEYAIRAGTTTKYYCGDDENCLDDIAWYDANSGSTTYPVGRKNPNAWGLYDMSGNVCEWCQDWYHAGYYSVSPSTDPQGPNSGLHRVHRGGSWFDPAKSSRSADRYGNPPSEGGANLGFRLALPQ